MAIRVSGRLVSMGVGALDVLESSNSGKLFDFGASLIDVPFDLPQNVLQAAYLGMQDRKFGLDNEWRPYLKYEPLGSDCSDTELRETIERRTEAVCGMCPARVERMELGDPVPASKN